MQDEELVFYFCYSLTKHQKPNSFNFACSAFISSTFVWRSSPIWNYDLFLENSDASSLPFYSYLQIIRKQCSKGDTQHFKFIKDS